MIDRPKGVYDNSKLSLTLINQHVDWRPTVEIVWMFRVQNNQMTIGRNLWLSNKFNCISFIVHSLCLNSRKSNLQRWDHNTAYEPPSSSLWIGRNHKTGFKEALQENNKSCEELKAYEKPNIEWILSVFIKFPLFHWRLHIVAHLISFFYSVGFNIVEVQQKRRTHWFI